jgi:endoglucanase
VQQRNWVLGANAWGTSLVIGEGTVFPHCPQHQVANLTGSLTGGREVLVGGVVNGRNRFAAFDRADARFLDDVRAWPSVEPAIDFTATGMLAFALAAAG